MPFKRKVSVRFAFKSFQMYKFLQNHFLSSCSSWWIPESCFHTLPAQLHILQPNQGCTCALHLACLCPTLQLDLAREYTTLLWPEDGNEKWGFQLYFFNQVLYCDASSWLQSNPSRHFFFFFSVIKNPQLHLYTDEATSELCLSTCSRRE